MDGKKAGSARPAAIGRYRIVGELGRGAMGLVYKAEDTALGRTVAIKTIELAFAAGPADRSDFEKRFLAEASIAACLSHPGIVMCHDIGKDPETGVLFIVLEHLQGTPLSEVVKTGSLLPTLQAISIVAKVARALHYAHAHGVVHRDMKPANVMLLDSGDPKILDFGVAKLEGGNLTVAGRLFGSPLYMSPEQALVKPVDGRSDLFSLGSILYALLVGRHPFAAENIPTILTRVVGEDPTPVSQVTRGLPASIDYVIARALAKDPGKRYASGDQMAEDLEDVAAGREPRHRAGWVEPVGGHTIADGDPLEELESLVESPAPPLAPRAEATRRHDVPRPAVSPVARASETASGGRTGLGRLRNWAIALAAVAVLGGGIVLFGRDSAEKPGPPRVAPSTMAPDTSRPRGDGEPERADVSVAAPAGEAEMRVVLRHFVRKGQVRLFVNGALVLDTEIRAQQAKKIVAVTIREGRYTQTLLVPAGKHEIRVEVDWDEHRRVLHTFANFTEGSVRTLDLELVRLTRELEGSWR